MKNKIISLEKITKIVADLKKNKKKIVLVSGVFDVLHLGHIKYFETAKKHGKILIVSLTKDKYVNKGINRPIFNHFQRSEVLSSISTIDYIVFSDDYSCSNVIKKIKPNIYAKGSDYKNLKDDLTKNILKEKKLVNRYGGKLIFIDEETFSSSKLISDTINVYSNQQKNFIKKIKTKYSFEEILNFLKKIKDTECLCIGETIIDKYVYCEALGKSGKEAYLVLNQKKHELYLGGAAAIARQVSEFSKRVSLITIIGQKKEFLPMIKKELPKVNIKYVTKDSSPTIVKERFVEEISKNKIFGTYKLNQKDISSTQEKDIKQLISKTKKNNSLILLSDYGHGMITNNLSKFILKSTSSLFLNTQINAGNIGIHTMSKYKNFNTLIVNERELRHELRDSQTNIIDLGKKIMKRQKIKTLIITKGSSGAILINKKKKIYCPSFTNTAIDKVGAGDAMLSIMSICIKNKIPDDLSIFFGSIMGALSVQIIGNKKQVGIQKFIKTIQYILK